MSQDPGLPKRSGSRELAECERQSLRPWAGVHVVPIASRLRHIPALEPWAIRLADRVVSPTSVRTEKPGRNGRYPRCLCLTAQFNYRSDSTSSTRPESAEVAMASSEGCVYVGLAGETVLGREGRAGLYRSRGGEAGWDVLGVGLPTDYALAVG
jgi:hypothetical protein